MASNMQLQIKEAAKQLPVVEAFCQQQKVFVAGSSWQPDEDIFIRYFNEHPEWKMVIAPHVIGEDHLQQIIGKLEGRKVVRYSQATEENVRDAEVLISDCFGLLSSIYRYATVCYVGGGFGVSIHNTLEAAVWGKPVIFGPENKKFQEAQGLKQCGGGFEIHDADEFNALMNRFEKEADALTQASQAAGTFVRQRAGATQMILSDVQF